MAKLNWDTATPAQAKKMNDLIGENQRWAAKNLGKSTGDEKKKGRGRV